VTPFDEAGYPLTPAGDVSVEPEDGRDIFERARVELERDEAADMAYYRVAGWPAGGS
jgi:hypothetical protein